MIEAGDRAVISIFPDAPRSEIVASLVGAIGGGWRHMAVTGNAASRLLQAGELLRNALGRGAGAVRVGREPPERGRFSEAVSDAIGAFRPESRYLVVAPSLVPLDFAIDGQGTSLGDSCVVSHLFVGELAPMEAMLRRALTPTRLPLGTYLLMCPMAMDRSVPRHLQDIVSVALSLEGRLPVEVWAQPKLERALDAFSSRNVSWLHIDTHGDPYGRSIMLGPTRESRVMVKAERLPGIVVAPLVIACGCGLNGGAGSVGATMYERGALAVFGPCVSFVSLGVANSEEGEAAWYRTFFSSLLAGHDVGASLLVARRSTAGSVLKYAWIVTGSSVLSFGDLQATRVT